MKLVILAAGVGSRLGRPLPKSLSVLPDGNTIIGRQIKYARELGISEIIVVVGFKMNLIMENFPDVFYKYNPFYYITNTSKSLLSAVEHLDDDVLWINGDVVFEKEILQKIIDKEDNIVAVNTSLCGDEEVKYTTDNSGKIIQISKKVENGEGEAVGINKILKKDLNCFKKCLTKCDDSDYFEKGIEYLIEKDVEIKPLNISEYKCMEVDFIEDWNEVLKQFN